MPQDFSIIFVVDPPGLVLDSILLLASIRKHMPDVPVVPYCPAAKAEALPPQLTEFFAHHDAPIRLMQTEGVFATPYKQGNKLLAAAAPRDTAATLFLDTDVMVMRAFGGHEVLQEDQLSAAPEGRMTWGKMPEMWPSAYDTFGLPVPQDQIRLARSNALSSPYFNAGVVGFPDQTPSGHHFGQLWLETSQRIDANDNVPGRRPWLDQIALPIAMIRAGLSMNLLPSKWNLSLSHNPVADGKPPHVNRLAQAEIDKLNAADPVIAHYHNHPALARLRYGPIADALIAEFTPYASIQDLRLGMVGQTPSKAAILKEFHTLKAMTDRTPEQSARFREVDALKRAAQSGKLAKGYYADWPDTLVT
ncbi:hypothetical protein PANO111632_00020 [Paracoccus nototheniae]|uniref:Uncharacterized protein n=1 Tax=Paracoccus nototheniae TaxID=2489002 RepID=A0ABW4E2P8_9RHOB|nr:hypothetical protein [Paracoccus nototheniae]